MVATRRIPEWIVSHYLQHYTPGLEKYAFKIGSSTFGIFDAFADEGGRDAHLGGAIAKALLAKAEDLFATPPQIGKLDLLATKNVSA